MKEKSIFHFCPYDGGKLIISASEHRENPVCSVCGFVDYRNPKPCVAILIVRENKILLGSRAISPAKGMWDIPGGFIDTAESAEEAVIREAFEETTLHVRITGFLGSISDTYGTKQEPTLNLCFITEIEDGQPQAKSDVESLKWFDFNDLPSSMAFTHQQEMLIWGRDFVALKLNK